MAGCFLGEVHLEMLDDGQSMVLLKGFTYIDPRCQPWPVPTGAKTDGASIPRFLWSIIGGPFEGRYRKPAIVHDFHCDVRLCKWEDVHRMFYEAMLTADVDSTKAKLLYFGVRLGGPRWTSQASYNSSLVIPPDRLDPKGITFNSGGGGSNYHPGYLPNPRKEVYKGYRSKVSAQLDSMSLDDIDKLADEARQEVQSKPIFG